jgi:hypothetical protein
MSRHGERISEGLLYKERVIMPSVLRDKIRSMYLLSMWSILFMLSIASEGMAQTPPVAATPPMGWNSWNHFAEKIDDATVRAQADAMVSSGMRDAGYIYINIDDTWQAERDAQGSFMPTLNSRT